MNCYSSTTTTTPPPSLSRLSGLVSVSSSSEERLQLRRPHGHAKRASYKLKVGGVAAAVAAAQIDVSGNT